jgi:DNA polymerase-3 subunit alpha
MEVGYFIYIKGRVDNRWGKENDFELKVQGIEMLNEVRDKYFTKITVQLELTKLNNAMLQQFQSLPKEKPGNCILNFDFIDTDENTSLRMLSTKVKFSPSNEVLSWLDELNLSYKLN